MELQIIPKNSLVLSEAVEKYARKRVGKLDRYLASISEGKLEITQEGTRLPEQRFGAQLTLNSNGILIRAQGKASDIRVAIDEVMDAITNRIERYKGKLYDKGRGISLARQGATETTEGGGPRVVKNKQFPVKPMSQDEAISQMELLGHDFFLFINAEDGTPNLLYRRKDGNYGLIESVIE